MGKGINVITVEYLPMAGPIQPIGCLKHYLSIMSTEQFVKEVFQGLPSTVTTLDMSGSNLWKIAGDKKLALGLQAIPLTVTSLDFSGNNLGRLSNKKLSNLLKSIPGHIKIINLAENNLFLNKSYKQKDKTLLALGKQRERFILTANGESDRIRFFSALTRKPITEDNEPNVRQKSTPQDINLN